MTGIFQAVLNMSITGIYIGSAVIVLRIFMKKLPKKFSYALWSILLLRLICPFSFSSAISAFNLLKPTVSQNSITYLPYDAEFASVPSVNVGIPPINDAVNSILPESAPYASANPMQIWLFIFTAIWISGIIIITAYSAVSYFLVKRKVKDAEHLYDNVYKCYGINSPFVYGILHPRIYIPSGVSDEDLQYILAHERAHIKRKDHIIKLAGLAVLTLHWFNPMMWVCFRLMSMDMELSCDEIAVSRFKDNVRKEYASALLNISMKQNHLNYGGLLSFGESGIKTRIKSVLAGKKPKLIVSAAVILLLSAAAVCLLTNPFEKSELDVPAVNIVELEDMSIGSELPRILYADENKAVFSDYYGTFVYDFNTPSVSESIDTITLFDAEHQLRFINSTVSDDGKSILLSAKPFDASDDTASEFYLYKIGKKTLKEIPAYEAENFMKTAFKINPADDSHKTETMDYAPLKNGGYVYVTSAEWKVKHIRIIKTDAAGQSQAFPFLTGTNDLGSSFYGYLELMAVSDDGSDFVYPTQMHRSLSFSCTIPAQLTPDDGTTAAYYPNGKKAIQIMPSVINGDKITEDLFLSDIPADEAEIKASDLLANEDCRLYVFETAAETRYYCVIDNLWGNSAIIAFYVYPDSEPVWDIDGMYRTAASFNLENPDSFFLSPPLDGESLQITNGFEKHGAIDILANYGEDILSACPGTVTFVGQNDDYGNYVIIGTGDDFSVLYANLWKISVREGDSVGSDTVIGTSGNSGYSTGPHLHFEVRKNNIPQDPLKFFTKSDLKKFAAPSKAAELYTTQTAASEEETDSNAPQGS